VLAAARGAPGGATSLLPALAKALNVVTRLGTRPSRPASYARAFELLASWLPYGSGPDWETFLYREMGVHAADAGNPEAAMDLAERALEVADRAQDPAAVRVARRVKAGVLISVGQFEAAAAFLPRELAVVPARRLLEMLHWSQCLLGMGERSAAVRYLNGGYDLAAAYDYPRAGLDVVTQEFDRR